MTEQKPKSSNQSIERTVELLGYFKPERSELTLAELTAMTGQHRATVHRYAIALRNVGLLRYDRTRGLYSLGPRIVELAATALSGLSILKLAGPHMEGLVAEVNETCVMSVWDGSAPVVMRVDSNTDRIVRIIVQTGSRLPLTSAQGKIHCVFNSDVEDPPMSRAEIGRVRSAGLAFADEVIDGIRAIAAPVFQEGELVAAIALVGTTAGMPESADSVMAKRLRNVAEALSAELGGPRQEGEA